MEDIKKIKKRKEKGKIRFEELILKDREIQKKQRWQRIKYFRYKWYKDKEIKKEKVPDYLKDAGRISEEK